VSTTTLKKPVDNDTRDDHLTHLTWSWTEQNSDGTWTALCGAVVPDSEGRPFDRPTHDDCVVCIEIALAEIRG